ncbi:hypothetical protein Ocin01_17746 [Orchesella cincta]|uniref:Amidase domain-containing protein n=1 Tax=Orchesella cincta TaxID=48709 RepID=A0A1D2M7J3_ORCCI|nr:hypothetical protein Ocin01_17746 [Orchesella cincta]
MTLESVGNNKNGSFHSAGQFSFPKAKTDSETLTSLDADYSQCNGIDIREITITRLQELFSTNQLTSRELTSCYLQRIRALNPYLNAVIETNPDALSIALKLDKERKLWNHLRSPLHGIPVLIKDNYATRDRMETTAGSFALLGVQPVRDSDAVAMLRKAGAVILGKANLAEFSFFRGTNVPNGWSGRGGQVKNPYNLNFSPQGSSSGSSVSTATNLATATLGTETDGSLISPSSVASCVSMKSTLGLVSTRGIIPVSHTQDVVPFRIGIPREPFWVPEIVDSPILNDELPVLNKLLEKIKEHRLVTLIDPVNTPWERLRNISEVEVTVVLHDFKHDINRYLREETVQFPFKKIRTLKDIITFNNENPSPEGYNQDLLELSQTTDGLQNETYIQARSENLAVTKEYLNELLFKQGLDAIAVPSEPRYDTNSNPSLRHSPFVGWTVAAISGYPSITLPVGYDGYGVPFGICLVGKPYSEVTLLRIAKLIEETFPARKRPQFLNDKRLTSIKIKALLALLDQHPKNSSTISAKSTEIRNKAGGLRSHEELISLQSRLEECPSSCEASPSRWFMRRQIG